MPEKFVLYVKPTCPWCISAKAYLDENGYEYLEHDVLKDRARYDEMIRLSGQSLTPTLVVGDKLLADFGIPELKDFLKSESLRPAKE